MRARLALLLIAGTLVLVISELAPADGILTTSAVFATGATGRARSVLRGRSDQNQPLLLRVDRQRHRLRFRIGLLVTRCHGPGSGDEKFGAPRATVLRSRVWVGVGRRGHASTSYRFRQHPHHTVDGLLDDVRIRTDVTFRATIQGRRAQGTFRVRSFVRHVVDTTEGIDRARFVCDSGTRRWRVPGIRFSGPWRPTGPMFEPRSFGNLVALADGRVLLAGGSGAATTDTAKSSEIYNPRTNRWRRTGSLRHLRQADAVAVRLLNGNVLLAGGTSDQDGETPLRTAELYRPRLGRWTRAAPMPIQHSGAAATLLADGRVLVAGGFRRAKDGDATPTASVEVYDPARNVWSEAARLPGPWGDQYGDQPVAARLSGDRVLVADGSTDSQTATATVYDVRTNSWSARQPIPGFAEFNGSPAATRGLAELSDGRILAVSACLRESESAPFRSHTAIFGPTGWRPAAPAPFCANGLADRPLVTLPSGRVLFASLFPSNRAALYDVARDHWTPAAACRFPHLSGSLELATAPGGALLISEGLNRFSSAERFFEH